MLRYRLMPGREWLWVGYDHYVVITGMVGDDFVINDPIGINGHGERVLSGQQLLRAWMNSDFPGAAVAIVQGDETMYANGFGVLETGSDQPLTADTLFMVGSTNKSMTTTMMATLVDEDILDWDRPVVDSLPTFALSDPEASPEIRVRDLVNMSTGVARFDAPLFLLALPADQMIESLADKLCSSQAAV